MAYPSRTGFGYTQRMFLNLSHHSSSDWSSAQLSAAAALAGEVRDFNFPDVPPELNRDEVLAVGAGVVRMALAMRPSAAMVQGEFVLTFCVVHALELARVRCYAATTRRIASSVALPTGQAEKYSEFEFVQFRRYGFLKEVTEYAS